jgi:hypothetical protein
MLHGTSQAKTLCRAAPEGRRVGDWTLRAFGTTSIDPHFKCDRRNGQQMRFPVPPSTQSGVDPIGHSILTRTFCKIGNPAAHIFNSRELAGESGGWAVIASRCRSREIRQTVVLQDKARLTIRRIHGSFAANPPADTNLSQLTTWFATEPYFLGLAIKRSASAGVNSGHVAARLLGTSEEMRRNDRAPLGEIAPRTRGFAASARLGEQRQLPGRHALAHKVGEWCRIIASEAVVGKLRTHRITPLLAHCAIDAVD